MSNYLNCPFCSIKYNLTTNIAKFSQCGGLCCSSCISNPCRMCKSVHTLPAKDFLPFKDDFQKNLVTCICLKHSAVFIDGKSFLPYCSSCVKSYQKGFKVDESEFGLYVDNIFVYFVEKFRNEKKNEMAEWMIEHGVEGLSDKLMTIRMAEQYSTENVYCSVHMDRPAGFVNNELQFHCGCEKDGVKLTDHEDCKSLINKFIGKTGLINKFLSDQLKKSQDFSSIKSIFEAKRLKRGIKPSDICSLCTRKFGPGPAFQLSSKNFLLKDQFFQIVCNKCKKKIFDSEKESFEFVGKKVEYSVNCSNCSKGFLVLYNIPIEDQNLIPYKIICGHNVCKNCASMAQVNKIFCKICQLSFTFNSRLNMTLLKIINETDIYCEIHYMPIIGYSFGEVLKLYCEKCGVKINHISELYSTIHCNFKHLLHTLDYNDLVPENTISNLKKLTLIKQKLEVLSEVIFENWFTSSGSIQLHDTSSQESIDDFAFCMTPSNSIVITSIEFAHTNIEAKIRVSLFKGNSKLKVIKIFQFSLSAENSTVDLKPKGYLPLIQNEFYEIAVFDTDGCYTGYKIINPITTSEGLQFDFFFSAENESAQYSLIKSINYLILPN